MALLAGCPSAPTSLDLLVPAEADECSELCVLTTVSPAGVAEVTLLVDGQAFGSPVTTDADGQAEVCAGGLSVGAHQVSATSGTASGEGTVTVRAFGFAEGLLRDETALDSLPWTPTFSRSQVDPVFRPGAAGTWDSVAVALPTVAATDTGWVMGYAGSDGGDYVIGAATSPDGLAWTRAPDNPLHTGSGTEGDWKRYSVNSPMFVSTGDEWAMFYDGRGGETGNINIGLATGPDALHVSDDSGEPVFRWTEDEESWAGQAVAHPSVLLNAEGFWELWYSTGLQKLGYAYSTDGRTWSRYCHNPVFVADAANPWENDTVKAAEVIETADGYAMTYSAGGKGTFQVGWAMSRDGLHWQRAAEPVLSPGTEAWEARAVLSAPLAVVGDELWMWYTGTDGVGSSVGLAKAAGFP